MPAAEDLNVLNGSLLILQAHRAYRARLSLGSLQCLGSPRAIQRKFQREGFESVRVYTSEAALPVDWPAQFHEAAGYCARYVEGVWSLASGTKPRPREIDAAWLHE